MHWLIKSVIGTLLGDLFGGIRDILSRRKGAGLPEALIFIVLVVLAVGGEYLKLVEPGTLQRVIDVLLGAVIGNGMGRRNGQRRAPFPPTIPR